MADRATDRDDSTARRPLQRLVTIIVAAISLGGSLLIGVIFYAGSEMNAAALQRQQELIENALDQAVVQTLSEQKSIALWDDGAAKIRPGRLDTAWLDVEYGAFLIEAYGHDEIYLLGPDDRPVYAYDRDGRAAPARFAARAAQALPIVAEMRGGLLRDWHRRDGGFGMRIKGYSSLAGARAARWGANLLLVDGRPAIVSAITVVPTADLSLAQPRPFILVSIARIDPIFLRQIGRSLLIPDLKFRQPGGAPTSGGTRLIADDGTPAAALAWTAASPGTFLLSAVLPLVVAAILAVAGFSAFLLRRLLCASRRLARQEAVARHQAMHDPLSGLPNRRAFSLALGAALRGGGAGRFLAYLDIDRFKDINDTLGHRVGDRLVGLIAARLHAAMRPGDLLARFGGDEFAVLPGPGGEADAERFAETLRAAFASPYLLDGHTIRVTASIGVAELASADDADTLMRNADIALYAAKDAGRDRHVRFTPEMARAIAERRELETDLAAALRCPDGGGLRMVYQPILGVAAQDFIGVEALARWTHPVHGAIPPMTFVPIAEAAGLMPELGRFVLERAFADAARWPRLEVSINLSPAQLRHAELTEQLRGLLSRYQVEARRIVLEITETVLLEASAHTRATLLDIRALGFRTALDDFGTGYSSLSYLREYAFDKIKIDRSFVRGVDRQRDAMTIVQAVVALGRGLGMTVVAEGVEDEAEASLMRFAGCDELQGYLFSRPIEVEAIDAMAAATGGRVDRRRAGRPFSARRAARAAPPPPAKLPEPAAA